MILPRVNEAKVKRKGERVPMGVWVYYLIEGRRGCFFFFLHEKESTSLDVQHCFFYSD
jgi:hypothetical protein